MIHKYLLNTQSKFIVAVMLEIFVGKLPSWNLDQMNT